MREDFRKVIGEVKCVCSLLFGGKVEVVPRVPGDDPIGGNAVNRALGADGAFEAKVGSYLADLDGNIETIGVEVVII